MYITYILILQKPVFPAATWGHSLVRLSVISVNLPCSSGRINAFISHPKKDSSSTDQILPGPSRALLILQTAYKKIPLIFLGFVLVSVFNYSFRNDYYYFCCH